MILFLSKVPLVPFLPAFSIFVNVYLMMKLSTETWVSFTVLEDQFKVVKYSVAPFLTRRG